MLQGLGRYSAFSILESLNNNLPALPLGQAACQHEWVTSVVTEAPGQGVWDNSIFPAENRHRALRNVTLMWSSMLEACCCFLTKVNLEAHWKGIPLTTKDTAEVYPGATVASSGPLTIGLLCSASGAHTSMCTWKLQLFWPEHAHLSHRRTGLDREWFSCEVKASVMSGLGGERKRMRDLLSLPQAQCQGIYYTVKKGGSGTLQVPDTRPAWAGMAGRDWRLKQPNMAAA